MQEMQVPSLDEEDPLEEEKATHSSIFFLVIFFFFSFFFKKQLIYFNWRVITLQCSHWCMAENHSSILAWKIPWTEDPGELQPMGSWRVRHRWAHRSTSPHFLLWIFVSYQLNNMYQEYLLNIYYFYPIFLLINLFRKLTTQSTFKNLFSWKCFIFRGNDIYSKVKKN